MEQGTLLGSYRILGRLGEGGMGEVYLAEDTGLKRQVAVKVLPAELATDPERLARMRREAQLLAQLSHPNVAAIHGIESATGPTGSGTVSFRVMERADGVTLADRIAAGPVPVDEAIDIARQIAEGLESAHERGIVHRDLKPANVMVAEGPGGTQRVKILDFGLAKAAAGELLERASGRDLSISPTVALTTGAGVILGTAAYMSPEQARGKPVDRRADVWAFGCVLYEMLTGAMPFHGDTVTDVLASVVKEEPRWAALPAVTPQSVRVLLRRCLDKDAKRRLRDIGEARVVLESPGEPAEAEQKRGSAGVPWPVALGAVAVVAAAAVLLPNLLTRELAPAQAGPMRLTLPLPASLRLQPEFPRLAISPDGRAFAYAALEGAVSKIFLQTLDEFEPRAVAGTEGGSGPIFSPDGRWLGYFIADVLYRIPVEGGTPQLISETTNVWDRDAFWHTDGNIYLGGDTASFGRRSLQMVSAEGGGVRQITETREGEHAHDGPTLLPDGSVLFGVLRQDGRHHLARYRPDTGEVEALEIPGVRGWWIDGGYLLVADGSSIRGYRFDLASGGVTGDPRVLVSSVEPGHVAVTPSGALAYVTRGTGGGTVVAVDRDGQATTLLGQVERYRWPRVSPDGTRLVIGIRAATEPVMGLWLHELTTGRRTAIGTATGSNTEPVWSPDGARIAMSAPGDVGGLVVQRADGSQPPEVLYATAQDPWPTDWSPDGRHLVFYTATGEDGSNDIWILEMGDEPRAEVAVGGAGGQRLAVFSPDGRWLAYSAEGSAGLEVFLQPFPGLDRRWTVSVGGGTDPQWSPDGSELFYRHEGGVHAVEVTTSGSEVRLGAPRLLFSGNFEADPNGDQSWDVLPDGRFVLIQPAGEDQREMRVILGVTSELSELPAR